MLAEALAEAQGDPTKHTVRLETLFAEATAKTIIAEGSMEARYVGSADQMETSLRGSSAEGRGRKGCYF